MEGQPRSSRDAATQNASNRTTAYELCNVFGTPTGRRVMLAEGEPLPAVPNGWSWQKVAE